MNWDLKLRDYIEKLDESSLLLVASQYGFETQGAPVQALRNRLIRVLEDPSTLEKAYQKLPLEGKKLLHSALASGNQIRESEARSFLGGGPTATRILHEAVSKGFIMPFYLGHSQNIFYVIPQEMVSLLASRVAWEESIPEVEEHRVFGLGLQGFLQDILTFLTYLKGENVKVTQQHELYKRNRQEVASQLLADRLSLVEYTCQLMDLVRYGNGRASLQEENVEYLAALGWQDHARLFLQTARMGSIGGFGNEWSRRYLQIFEDRFLHAYPRWTDFSKLLHSGKDISESPMGQSYDFQNYLNLYFSVGILEEGRLDGHYYYRLSPEGAYALGAQPVSPVLPLEGNFYLQPSLEVLFPYNLDPKIRWKLSAFTQLEKADQMMSARLSQESITQGIDGGMELDEILRFLKEYSKTGVPQNVEYSIREWGEKYGQVYLMDALILRIRHPEMVQAIRGIKDVSKHILGEITPQDLIVKGSGAGQILKALTKAGYSPLKDIQFPSDEQKPKEDGYYQYLQHPPEKLLNTFGEWKDTAPKGAARNFVLLLPADLLASQQPIKVQPGKMLYNPNGHILYEMLEEAIQGRKSTEIIYLERGLGRTTDMIIQPLNLVYTHQGWSLQCRHALSHGLLDIPLKDIVAIRA
jgi:hypothetical protein